MIAVLVLAGGAGRRFGGAKQLHEVDGRPMLERVVAIVNAAELGEVVVVLGARAGEVAAAVDLGTRAGGGVRALGGRPGRIASLRPRAHSATR